MTDRREMEEPPVRRLAWESPAAPEQTILRAREGFRFLAGVLLTCRYEDASLHRAWPPLGDRSLC